MRLWTSRAEQPILPCVVCEGRPGDPERYGRCLSCYYDVPPPVPCEVCGTRSWAMEEGWFCLRCSPDGPWVPGFGPDNDRPQDPRMLLQVKVVAGRALGMPPDDVTVLGQEAS